MQPTALDGEVNDMGLAAKQELAAVQVADSLGIYPCAPPSQSAALCRHYAASLGDAELLRRIERAMAAAEATVEKRKATVAARRVAVA